MSTNQQAMPILSLKRSIRTYQKPQVEIQNVVATAGLNQRLALDAILKVTPGATFNPARFPGLVYKLKKPKTTTLLFSSGKMVCTGAKSTKSAKTAITRIISELRGNGVIIIANPTMEIQNVVASGDLHGAIDLENVAERLFRTMYEPEQFPGLVYRMTKPYAVFLVFASGKIVCTGTKTETDVNLAVENLLDTLELNGLISFHKPPYPNEEGFTELLNETPLLQT
jgi:transcription initiation factor TFIID TATA-box-binding protein